MSQDAMLELAARFSGAIERGDLEAVRAIYAPDAVIWHNFDRAEQSVSENLKTLAWLTRVLSDRHYEIQRREALPDGYLQQHELQGRLPSGKKFSMPACLIVQVRDGRIQRLDEYLDLAQAAIMSEEAALLRDATRSSASE